MSTNKASRSFRVIIIEFVLMLAVLVIMSVIIVKMFLSADRMAKDSQDYSKAVIRTESIAEYLKGSTSFEDALTNLDMEKIIDGDKVVYQGYYGPDWEQDNESGVYIVTVYLEQTAASRGKLEKAEIVTTKANDYIKDNGKSDSLCKLNVSKFIYN